MYQYAKTVKSFVQMGIEAAPVVFDEVSKGDDTEEPYTDVTSVLIQAIAAVGLEDKACVALYVTSMPGWLIRSPKVDLPIKDAFLLGLREGGDTILNDMPVVRPPK